MTDYIYIGCVPSEEPCEQLGPNYDPSKARKECKIFREQLRRVFGDEPEGAKLRIQGNSHDFGTYYEVICEYEEESPEAGDYGLKLESEMPEFWDKEAKEALLCLDEKIA